MEKYKVLNLILFAVLIANNLNAQIGYYDAPYVRYEANNGTLANGAAATTMSFNQSALQSEASEQVCVNLSSINASVDWNVSVAGDGLVVRYSVPDGQSAVLDVLVNNVDVGDLNLTSYYSWEYLSSNGNPNNVGVVNTNPKMRFDEVRLKLPAQIAIGGNLKLVRKSSTSSIHIDFAELEPVPAVVGWSSGNVTYTGNGSDLQTFIDNNGGATIYMPQGTYNVGRDLFFGAANTTLKGAGMWYTRIHFTSGAANDGGLWGQAANISYSGLYLTTDRNSRSSSYKAINGVYTNGATITNIWAEHFECGAWIAQYGTGPATADGFTMSNCRFRNNYADGTNLCKGTKNAIVQHCSFRNNGDDDMAIWSANGMECQNNTFRYNTSENCWRASGCAIYGGLNNKAHNLLIQDNLEVGIKVNNAFAGAGFNGGGMHEIYNIVIKRCGTNQDLFNRPVGAIDLGCYDYGAGTRVQNVKFSCISILDSKNDAIYIDKVSSASDGFYNLIFENITINGTGREYPDNGGTGTARGYMILFDGSPSGNATYCGMTYSNRGGNASVDVNTSNKGPLSWTQPGTCPGGCVPFSTALTTITSPTNGSTFGGCPVGPITITASSTPPAGNTVNYLEFFVDGLSIGTDYTSSYSISWNSPADGSHAITAVAHYLPSNTTSTSPSTNINVGLEIRQVSSVPTIDGNAEVLWNSYGAFSLTQGYSSAPDLAAKYKIMYDATNLYLFIDVTDDDLRNESVNDWEDDGVEIFIDIGNDKAATYSANDYQYGLNYGTPATIAEYKNNAMTGVTFAQAIKTGGYTMEIKLPWSTLGGTPTAGASIGFEIKINDDDGGGTRDNELAWKDGTFGSWNNPALFGTLQFSNCGPLPVSLLSFTSEVENEKIVLSWATANELNNKKFIVERSSNLIDWSAIGEVVGAGTTSFISNYSFTDYGPLEGIAYYRLRQVDSDDAYVFSHAVVVEMNASNGIAIMPNPFDDVLTIQTSISGNMEISIHDMLGRLMYHVNKISDVSINIDADLPSGTYIITIQTETEVEQQKIIKK